MKQINERSETMPIHHYIEQHFQKYPHSRTTGIEVKNPPLEKRPKVLCIEENIVKINTTEIPIRIYSPNNEKYHPLFIFFHGGNFIPGGLDAHDVSCRLICSLSKYKVIAVNYSSSNGVDDELLTNCHSVTQWIIENAEQLGGLSDQIAIGGPSIGAFIATNIALHSAVSDQFQIMKQILHYPIIELNDEVKSSPHISRALFNGKYGIDITLCPINIIDNNFPSSSPIYSPKEHLSKLPKTLIFIAEYDPLFDEGERYAEKLKSAGVDVKLVRFDGNIHGFMQSFPGSPDYMRGYEITAEFLTN